jgi:hypothetical protein
MKTLIGANVLMCVADAIVAIANLNAYNAIIAIMCGFSAWYINQLRNLRKPKHEA